MKRLYSLLFCASVLTSVVTSYGVTVRVEDLVFAYGAQNNQLIGIGIVSGLANDGDKDPVYTVAAMRNFFQSFGISVPEQISSKNVAVVMVTATIPPFAKQGNLINVTVSAMGDAKSLQGGVLAQTQLYGVDHKTYALAQGPLTVGGFSLGNSGAGGANVQKNHPTTAMIVDGAIVETEIPVHLVRDDAISLVLRQQDVTTAARMAEAINAKYPSSSHVDSGSTITVKIPDTYIASPYDFLTQIYAIDVQPNTPAKVIINERTGTIVATARVKIGSCAVSHGNLLVKVSETLDVSQPGPFSQTGTTQVTPRTDTQVTEDKGHLYAFPDMPTVEKVAEYLNKMGATPRDMMAIFQAMQQAGALRAELVIQ